MAATSAKTMGDTLIAVTRGEAPADASSPTPRAIHSTPLIRWEVWNSNEANRATQTPTRSSGRNLSQQNSAAAAATAPMKAKMSGMAKPEKKASGVTAARRPIRP